ncbi:MAG: hypothetical protein M1819_003486 [Sarea resinae]|nr:MAG: hypothetical protein M1819_003486 [Sarea resinae]
MSLFDILLTGAVIGSTLFTIVLFVLPTRYSSAPEDGGLHDGAPDGEEASRRRERGKPLIQVVVLGDIGRSPRMQYHAISIAQNGGRVDLIGYRESDPHPEILSNPSITIRPIPPPPRILQTGSKTLFLLFGPLKVLWQAWSLWIIMGYRTEPAKWLLVQHRLFLSGFIAKSDIVHHYLQSSLCLQLEKSFKRRASEELQRNPTDYPHTVSSVQIFAINADPNPLSVQNPPSIPTLALSILCSYLRSTSLLIDWHNLSSTLLALRLSPTHPLVRLNTLHDRLLAAHATAHLTVTDAMASLLKRTYNITTAPIFPLHDRPAPLFRTLSGAERQRFLETCEETREHAQDILQGRTKLVVSSTSWTPDEDFGILLDALVAYAAAAANTTTNPSLPKILLVITGRGPLLQHYTSLIQRLQTPSPSLSPASTTSTTTSALPPSLITIRTAFLPLATYAALLGAADLGISLHTSSSGVDLPMKVVDMFGAGLPVLGVRFAAWNELVHENINGRGFGSAAELAALLIDLLGTSPGVGAGVGAGAWGSGEGELETLRVGARKEGAVRWADVWGPVAGRLLLGLSEAPPSPSSPGKEEDADEDSGRGDGWS